MQVLIRPWGAMHYRDEGPKDAPAVVFANSLGTDLRLWDAVLPLLSPGLRLIRHDTRGHGLSDLGGDADITALAEDAGALIDALGPGRVVFVGLSLGGLIGQALAAVRPDLIGALVLSNTAAKIGTPDSWQARIAAINTRGLPHIADAVLDRWFTPGFQATPALALWRNMLIRTPKQGYTAACAALATADLTASSKALDLPVLVVAGAEDGATPPDLVRATAALIKGAAYHCIAGTAHLPCVEAPQTYADILSPFLKAHAHV